jgi:hypothetical protein
MSHLVNADILGYYDFHWKRGPDQHFPHLLAYARWARERDAWFYTWLATTSGRAGRGNFNRSLYSANTGIACGLRGILWFLATDLVQPGARGWTEAGRDILRVNQEIGPLSREIVRLGNPVAVYSTPVSKTLNNADLPDGKKQTMPPGLEDHGFPTDFWLQPQGGEFVLGVFKNREGHDAVFVANHNAYAGQDVRLKLARDGKVELFNRREGKWQALETRGGAFEFKLGPAGGELLRFAP